jgi:hypothetical protein
MIAFDPILPLKVINCPCGLLSAGVVIIAIYSEGQASS